MTRRRGSRRGPDLVDRGSGTVLAVGIVSVLATLLLAGALVAAVAVTGQRARTAADLAALAAVAQAVAGASSEAACEVAAEVARRNGAQLEACRTTSGTDGSPRAHVVVGRSTPGERWQVTRRASAGAVPGPSAVQVQPAAVLRGGRP